MQQFGQGGIVGHHFGHEGWTGAVERGADRRRIDIKHAISEAAVDAGVAVMGLVGMDHHDLAAAAGAQRTAIVERLRPPQGQADGISLVAMQVVGMSAKARRQALQAGARLLAADLVGPHHIGLGHAQTFKTVWLSCTIWGA